VLTPAELPIVNILFAPPAVKFTAPPAVVVVPVVVTLPVLLTVTLPAPDSLMPAMDNVATVFVKLIFPLVVFVALKPVTALLALANVTPPTALTVKVAALIGAD